MLLFICMLTTTDITNYFQCEQIRAACQQHLIKFQNSGFAKTAPVDSVRKCGNTGLCAPQYQGMYIVRAFVGIDHLQVD